jgi:trehalose 6-phosphate phosphatase
MKILEPKFDLIWFIKKVGQMRHCALLVDFDGIIGAYKAEGADAVFYPDVREIMAELIEACRIRLVLVSRYSVKELIPMLGLKRLPEIWGCHGYERLMPDGTYEVYDLDTIAIQGLVEAWNWISSVGLGDRCERRAAGLTLHWESLKPEIRKNMRTEILMNLNFLTQEMGLLMSEFDGGIEIWAHGKDRGFVVETLIAEIGGYGAIAYLGSDLIDEGAFEAIKGRGLGILVHPQLRSTNADLWLGSREELLQFLGNLIILTIHGLKPCPMELQSFLETDRKSS